MTNCAHSYGNDLVTNSARSYGYDLVPFETDSNFDCDQPAAQRCVCILRGLLLTLSHHPQ